MIAHFDLKDKPTSQLEASKQPVHKNTGFKCENCGKSNPKATKSCRNHCRYCLFSKHVDSIAPGDRKSDCKGLMEPFFIDYSAKKGYQIIQRCLKCKKEIANILAEDDNMDLITKIMQRQNLENVINKGKKHG